MFSSQENDFKPRHYQDQILDIVLRENTIVYLPTGAGKTYIALMAMRHMAKDVQASISEGGKRTVFLANTVALVHQQAEVIRKATSLKTAVYTGDMNVDNWKRDKWNSEFENNQVIVATCQIILDVVRHGFISITNFNLVIFDECHHAKKGHPMHQLMAQFQNHKESELPRVIGLTGILVTSSNQKTLISDLETLEKVFGAKIATAANAQEFSNVLSYSTKPEELLATYPITTKKENICTKIELLIAKCMHVIENWELPSTYTKSTKNLGGLREKNPIKKLRCLFNDFLYQMRDFGVYGTSVAILSLIIDLELKKRASEIITLRELIRVCISYSEYIHHLLVEYLYDPDDDDPEEEHQIILTNSSVKVTTFLMNIQQMASKRNPDEIKGLIFVKRRHTAKNLSNILKRYVNSAKIPIVPEFMVGKTENMPESIETILEMKWDKNVLQRFHNNKSNIIVSTSVLEEGIDVQSCNFVYTYDPIQTFRAYIQTKGRARMQKSIYQMLVSSIEKPEILKKVSMYKEMDSLLKEYLVGKTIDRKIPTKDEIDCQFEHLIEPFSTPIGAKLVAEAAVPLLNRYCMSLPNDSYTKSTVNWEKTYENVEEKKVIVKITMPIQSSVRDDVFSDTMKSVKWAKRSAAFKACKLLYENNELNDNLLPINGPKCLNIVNDNYFKNWINCSRDAAHSAGLKKTKSSHKQLYPLECFSATPNIENICYLYIMRLEASFEKNDENLNIHDLLSTDNYFGILTTKMLPKLARMPLFLNQGQVTGFIDPNPKIIELKNSNDLIYLRNFHVMVFRDILKIWNNFFAYNFQNEENSYFIVPTKLNGKEIDWNLVKYFQYLSNVTKPTELQEAKKLKIGFYPDDYINRVVTPRYTADQDVRYVIKKVRQDLTPFSPFPTDEFSNFAGYFSEKYNVSVIQKDQFLLEAVPIANHLNLLHTGLDSVDGSTEKSIKRLDDIILIPELCHNFKFPGDMWLKAIFIPSILHRLHYLLIAENLRVDINAFLNISLNDYNPEDLVYDESLRHVPLLASSARPVIIPNPNEVDSTKLKSRPLCERPTKYNWKEYEEPCDLERNIDKVYTIEIDYYHQFITRNKFTEDSGNISSIITHLPAIWDDLSDDKVKINILEINKIVKSAEQWEFLSAITTSLSNDVFDMERFEVLGNSFLKFSISLFLLHEYPQWNERNLNEVKTKFVSNQNLFYASVKKRFPGSLKVIEFSPKQAWQPPLLSVPENVKELIIKDNICPSVLWKLSLEDDEVRAGKAKDETLTQFVNNCLTQEPNPESPMQVFIGTQSVNDKACADSIEAILGVCTKNYGIHKTFSLLTYLGVIPQNKNLSKLLYIDLGSPRLKTQINDKDIDSFLTNYKDLEKNLGYTFKDRAYLLQALTHPSFQKNRFTGCYQQLKFIGHTILDFLITCYIFERCGKLDPGQLTDLRSALVNNVTLACLSVRYKFHLHMLTQNSLLSQCVGKFTAFLETQKFEVTDQVRILVSEKDSDAEKMADHVEVPNALGDIFEALVGAVFLDSKNSLHTTWNIIYRLMSKEINKFTRNVPIPVVRRLYEYCGANPVFEKPIVSDDVVMVNCRFTFKDKIHVVSGFSNNKKCAKIAAAKLALQVLEQDNSDSFF